MILDAFSLAGKRALVTGGGGVLGSAMVTALHEAGAEVVIVGRSEKNHEVAASLGTSERPIKAVVGDLNDPDSLRQAFTQAVDLLGGLDILINSHGMVKAAPAEDYDLDIWSATIDSNLNSVFRLCQVAGRLMLAQGHGKIINIASMLSFSGGLRVAAYAASKGGVAQLTKALANEWASKGVNVNAIAPGYIKTPLNSHIWQDPVRNEQIIARLSVGHWGKPEDLKGAVVFLASAASDYVHGIILPVDGGWLAR